MRTRESSSRSNCLIAWETTLRKKNVMGDRSCRLLGNLRHETKAEMSIISPQHVCRIASFLQIPRTFICLTCSFTFLKSKSKKMESMELQLLEIMVD